MSPSGNSVHTSDSVPRLEHPPPDAVGPRRPRGEPCRHPTTDPTRRSSSHRRAAGAHPGDRRRHGHADPGAPAGGGRLPRRPGSPTTGTTSRATPTSWSLTQPDIIRDIHRAYLEAGADIVCTNTFTASSISQADYGLEDDCYELNRAAAALAREAADEAVDARAPALRRRLARADQPHGVDLPRRQRPRRPQRHLRRARRRRTSRRPAGLVDGGVDLLLVETIFDTLNAKAAIFALETLFDELGRRWPVWISGTITDASGRTLSGQTTEAFWNSVRHVRPLLDRPQLRARRRRPAPLRRRARRGSPTASSPPTPTPGCPTSSGSTTRRPTRWRRCSATSPTSGLVNLIGGCCGTTPEHIAAIARAAKGAEPRAACRASRRRCGSPGLEPFTIDEDSLFVNVGERTNITGSARFRKLIKDGDYDTALSVAAPAGRQRRAGHRRQHGRGHDRRRRRDGPVPQARRERARHQPGPGDGRLLEVGGHRGRPQVRAGQADRQLHLPQGGRGAVPASTPGCAASTAQPRSSWRSTRTARPTRSSDGRRSASGPTGSSPRRSGSRPRTSSSTRTCSPSPPASRSTRRTAPTSSRPPAGSSRTCPAPWSPAASPTCSFSFRGNNPVREAIHAVFLFHAIQAGLDLGIVNAGALVVYDQVDAELRDRIEDVVLEPPARRRRAAARDRRAVQPRPPRTVDGGRRGVARAAGLRADHPRAGQGASTATSRATPRSCAPEIAGPRRPPDRGDRGAADGRHERRRRPVRRRQDVPAAGREVRPGDEEGRRLPDPLHRGGEGQGPRARDAEGHQRHDRDGHGQGRRPRHRQEHRRRRPPVQQLRGHRPRRDGAGPEDPRHRQARSRPT